ncbi:type I restriction endonuclease [Lysinibacillus sp. ZYM-1]|uniref:type I restriction endonuclease n=1 Tax=Lysinibacillus sp. ZYM-1 TaxID=1681184 RepID=UPI0006CE62C4|nr:type I restriction endonuclease [Lysinibacillus sp. ZYM-1]KPN96079.1 hypothetical protein AO843_19030 [Lysinibacillus sp. ZYM-1]
MNEATLEARVRSELEKIIPNYQNMNIIHQHIFSVKIGHDEITIKPSTKKPRLDILIQYNGRNLAVLELKKPGHPLTDDDRKQGLSYARLLEPIAPLVIVSNGNDTSFYNSYSGEVMEHTSLDRKILDEAITHTLQMADSSLDEAVQILLGKDPDVWRKIIHDINKSNFNNQMGTINDYTQPIADNFHFPRKITPRIIEYVRRNAVVAVTGAPLVGKTNILYEICKEKQDDIIPIYINAEECRYGILQYLANQLLKHFKVSTLDDIKRWLVHGIIPNRHSAGKIVLIVDEVRFGEHEIIKDIDEIINLCSDNSSFSIIIGCDSSNFNLMSKRTGRPGKSLFGKKAIKVEVNRLDEEEFNYVEDMLIKTWSIRFLEGAIRNKEFREPRILRISLAQNIHRAVMDDSIMVIPNFLPLSLFKELFKNFTDDETFKNDMVRLARTALKQDLKTPLELMVSHGRGYVPYDQAEVMLGENRIERLREQGHIDWFIDEEQNQYIAPKTPEIFSAAAIRALYKDISMEKLDTEYAVGKILELSNRLPYGDIIAANVIFELGDNNDYTFYDIYKQLLINPPIIEKVNEKTDLNLEVYIRNKGLVKLPHLKKNSGDYRLISNTHPWLVLSHLMTLPFVMEGVEDQFGGYREILTTIGSYEDIIRRVDPIEQLDQSFMYSVHSTIEAGEMLCGEEGIIEPITYALRIGFLRVPHELIKICKIAVEEQNPFLSHRLYMAANSIKYSTDEEVSEVAQQALEILNAV